MDLDKLLWLLPELWMKQELLNLKTEQGCLDPGIGLINSATVSTPNSSDQGRTCKHWLFPKQAMEMSYIKKPEDWIFRKDSCFTGRHYCR